MRNRRHGPPQLRSIIMSFVACALSSAIAGAQLPPNGLRSDAPRPALRASALPSATGGTSATTAPSTTLQLRTPLTGSSAAATPRSQPAALIPTVPPAGGAVPTELRIVTDSPSGGAKLVPPATGSVPSNGATPSGASGNGSQLEIRRPTAPTTAVIVPPANPTPTVNAPSGSAAPGAGGVRLVPGAAAAPTTLAVPSLGTPAAPQLMPTPSATGPKIQPQAASTATAATNSAPAAATTIAGPVAIGGDESVGPLAVPVAPPLAIGGKLPAAAPTAQATVSDDALPAALPGLPQVAPLGTKPAATPTTVATAELEAVDFNGVTLGETTLEETIEAWGQPLERNTEGTLTRCRYQIPPFAGVDIAFRDGKSLSIIIDLGSKFPADAVAQELGITDVTPVAVEDDKGQALGLVYPERGTSFRFSPDADKQVIQIGLDRIDPRPFVLRAERNLDRSDSAALADAETAIKLDATNPRAYWIKARVLAACGRRREALAAAEAAIERDPKGAEYLLTRAGLLAEAGLFDAALTDAQTIMNGTPGAPQLQARAWMLRGNLLAEGPTRDYDEAIDAHTRAVRLAEPLVNDARPAVRRAAKELLVDAHLAIANDIAWGNWQQKETIVPQWLTKADKLAEGWIASGDLSPDVRLTVARQALTACVGVQGLVDPHAWSEKLELYTAEVLTKADDPLRRKRLLYEAGLGLYDALQAYHTRGDVPAALECGEAAVELLTQGREGRDETPIDPYRYGRLYFRVGSLYAVKKQDHAKAVEWFDRAAPLLERPLPEAAAADRGRQGETLVSMGVSYWAVGKRERGLELTNTGCRFMQQAQTDGLLGAEALAVPYTNLAVMHKQLGDQAAGTKFQEMATRADAGTLKR